MGVNADAIKAVLAADATLISYLTGGFWTVATAGRLGVSRINTPTAYDSTTGLMKPCMLLTDSSAAPDSGIADDSLQTLSVRDVVRLWFYADGDAGYATIRLARARAFALLHGKTVSTLYGLRWINELLDGHDPTLEHACFERDDYECRRLKTT
jgi:hypothetical protein